jgi:hypothetical protein
MEDIVDGTRRLCDERTSPALLIRVYFLLSEMRMLLLAHAWFSLVIRKICM